MFGTSRSLSRMTIIISDRQLQQQSTLLLLLQRIIPYICECYKYSFADTNPKGALLYVPIWSIVRPGSLHSTSAEENCFTENVTSLRDLKVATPLALLKRLSPVDLLPANLKKKHKRILRLILTIRRINCFISIALFPGRVFYISIISRDISLAVPEFSRRDPAGR